MGLTNNTNPSIIRNDILEQTQLLGFTLTGICSAEPPESFNMYQNWLSNNFHGSMDYMENSVPLRKNPDSILPDARSAIVVTLNYYQNNIHTKGMPRIAKYALGRDYHKVIKSKLKKLSKNLQEKYPEATFRPCVDSAPILEREYAKRAGIGWYGKNTCLINSQRGSWFFIGILLTNLEIETDKTAIGGCGTCKKCIEACPTGAIVNNNGTWQVNAAKCISYLTIEHKGEISGNLKPLIGSWTVGCDVCQHVCPFNNIRENQPLRSALTTEPDFLNKRSWPSLQEIMQLSYEEWDTLTQGSPVRRVGFEGLKRNAKINLDNERR